LDEHVELDMVIAFPGSRAHERNFAVDLFEGPFGVVLLTIEPGPPEAREANDVAFSRPELQDPVAVPTNEQRRTALREELMAA
jgi:hypothetical protein